MKRTLLTVGLAACAGLLACSDSELTAPDMSPGAAILPAQGASGVTVLTRNVYLGFEIDAVLAGTRPLDEGLAELLATDFPARAGALADEIAATRPHLVGLQEVIDYRVQDPGDFLTTFVPNATGQFIPFLDILMGQLAARGLDYEVAVKNPTTDVEVPLFTSPTTYMDIRYTDHDVVLVRGDVDYSDATAGIFAAKLSFVLPGGIPGSRPLGYAAVRATVNGRQILFVSTHLETQSYPDIQVAQIQELIGLLDDEDAPVVLVGDLNSAANPGAPAASKTDTYGLLLAAGYHDAWLAAYPYAEGLTCCYASDLVSAQAFDQRIDLVLVNDGAPALVGGVQAAIIGVPPFRSTQPKWASDHAGVAATLRLPVGPRR